MNLLLISPEDLTDDMRVSLRDKTARHLLNVIKVGLQDHIRVGIRNGSLAMAEVVAIHDEEHVEIKIDTETLRPPPKPMPCKLVMAMPRPKMMRRVIQNATSMGVKEIHLINAWKVEKSFWSTPWLNQDQIDENLQLGLEQSMDTILPAIKTHKLFKPFVEDLLPAIIGTQPAYVAHPYSDDICPINIDHSSTLIIGPEGGFTEYEIEKLVEAGASAVNIGPRILRVETAIPALLSRLYPGFG